MYVIRFSVSRIVECLIVCCFFFVSNVCADEFEVENTLSPYFFVKSQSELDVELLPLKHTEAHVVIAGVIADVAVTQVYQNTGSVPLEAIYVFPGSINAAVNGMRITIGERVRNAVIKKKKIAKVIYDKAQSEGKSAALLEQKRANVFQMNVANIMPDDIVKVELFYTELLVPEKGLYEFVYPSVVGPRYSNTPVSQALESERFVCNPYLTEGEKPPYSFQLSLELNTGIPIQRIASPSHEIDTVFETKDSVKIALKSERKHEGNRDFILRYNLLGEQIESGLLLYEGQKENFFLLMAQPPKRIGEGEVPPRDFVYIVDVSGSMHGFPLDVSKTLMKDMLGSLRSIDTFNVLLFAGNSAVLSPISLPATSNNIGRAIRFIENQRGSGGTELLHALERAMNLPKEENRSRIISVITDGYVSIEKKTFKLVRENLNDANVFAFGIGTSVNRYLIEGLARAGFGESFIVTKKVEAANVAMRFREYIQSPVLTNIELSFDGIELYDIEPPSIPDMLAERPVVVFGKWKGVGNGQIKLHGFTGDSEYTTVLDVANIKSTESNRALRHLWARQRIASLGDYLNVNRENLLEEQITELGLTYNLLTEFTSFVAVDDIVRNEMKEGVSVKQPLPLPLGVSNAAVGGMIPTVPEPEFYLFMAALFALFAFAIKTGVIQCAAIRG